MEGVNIITILAQLPFLAVFIWYFDRSSRQFQDFLREEREWREKNAFEERTARQQFEQRIIDRFDELGEAVGDHDVKFDRAIAVMDERTKKPTTRRSTQ